ncbi:MAG: hypothetical protein ABR509_04430 [Candidatus Limnocylindria bacterium]
MVRETDVLTDPDGVAFARLVWPRTVLVTGAHESGRDLWYRVEFEYCCDVSLYHDWIFGWINSRAEGQPVLTRREWSCPPNDNGLARLPEPVRWECARDRKVTRDGQLTAWDTRPPAYAGEPHWLTDAPIAGLGVEGQQPGDRIFPLHFSPNNELLRAWLIDARVKRGERVSVTGSFGPGLRPSEKHPFAAGLPEMPEEEQRLWCEQQFVVHEIHGDGPDPTLPGPDAPASWTPPPGTQPEAGDGWRLLASRDWRQVAINVRGYTVAAATTDAEYGDLWQSMSIGPPPVVDFTREFVVRFVPAVSSTCPWIAFTGIGVDHAQNLVFGEISGLPATLFVDPLPENFACTTDAVPHAFLVAIDRGQAPSDRFTVRLGLDVTCDGCGGEEIEVVLSP